MSQPVNRKTLTLQVTDYLKIENGDVYPSISQYILDGKKVNGRHIDVDIPFGFGFDGFNVFGRDWFAFGMKGSIDIQTVSGRLSRGVQYQKGVNRAYELLTNDARYDSLGNRIYLFDRKGYTFPRSINSARLTFSLNNWFKAGIHFLKAKDEFEKINTRASENSLFSVDTSIFGDSLLLEYTLSEFIDSLNNNDTVKIKKKNWDDGTPQENLVFGFDLEGTIDNRKLLFQLGWNMSLTNNNIWAGTASKDSLDLLLDTISDGKLMGSYDVSAIGDFIDTYSDIFTVHPAYMAPILPLDPIVAEKSSLKAFMNMPASAYFIRLKGSYSFNNVMIQYRQLGPEYKSFGNPYLTNNIREFTINDRLSTLGRRLMFVLGYKYRDNKLSDLVAHPIATRTISLNTTLVPGPGAPSIILNLQSIGRTNGIDSIDTDQYGNYLGDSRENSQALSDNSQEWSKNLTSKEALELLSEAMVPAGPVNNLSDVLDDEHVKEMDFFQNIDFPGLKKPAPVMGLPINLSNSINSRFLSSQTLIDCFEITIALYFSKSKIRHFFFSKLNFSKSFL